MNRMIPTGLLVVLMVSVGCSQGTPQRDHADAPVPPSDTANLSEAVATEEAATAFDQVLPSDPATAPPPVATAAPFATFADWCVNQASLTPDARHTVGVLLTTAATPDCNQAAAQLKIQIVEADADADLFIDGNYVGQVKEVMNEATGPLLLAPGAHRVEIRKPGRFPVQRTVRVDPENLGAQVVVDAQLLTNPE